MKTTGVVGAVFGFLGYLSAGSFEEVDYGMAAATAACGAFIVPLLARIGVRASRSETESQR